MDMKIPSTGCLGSIAELSEQLAETGASSGTPISSSMTDPLSQIALDISSGKISGEDGVNFILAHVMQSNMVASAPESLRAEVKSLLEEALSTDPHLIALSSKLNA